MPANDDAPEMRGMTPSIPDPHGQAALLLVESLIHGLLERAIISIGDAIDIVETAVSVQVDIAEAADGAGAPMWQSHARLNAILTSLEKDDDADSAPLRSAPKTTPFAGLADKEDER
ncbi:hypothetical protein EAH79_13685 [Sphingomonas koreensis]|nr:hypothetical protein EAH79_13685 [Sphingomonas koreensis]